MPRRRKRHTEGELDKLARRLMTRLKRTVAQLDVIEKERRRMHAERQSVADALKGAVIGPDAEPDPEFDDMLWGCGGK